MITADQIEAIAEWGDPKEVHTKRGDRILRKAKSAPGPEFWNLWRTSKTELQAQGISPAKDAETGEWGLCWWAELPSSVSAARNDSVELSRAVEVEYDVPSPEGCKFMPFQKACVKYCLPRQGVLIGDEMGCGKTLEAIGVINAVPEIVSVLVICPCNLRINWKRELSKWLVRGLSIGISTADQFPETQIVIINYDILHKFTDALGRQVWDLVIVDEAHRIKSADARRSRCIMGYKPTKKEIANGKTPMPGIPCKRKIALTGTPIPNRPVELFPILNWLDKENWGNWWKYVNRYCAAQQTRFGFDTSGSSNLPELQEKLRQTVMIRRLKSDVLKDLPPKRRSIVVLESDTMDAVLENEKTKMAEFHALEQKIATLKARVELAKAEDDVKYAAAVEELHDCMGSPAFEQISKIRYETAIAKLPLVTEYIEEMLESVNKVLVLAYHRDIIESLERTFANVGALKIYGGMEVEETQAAVDAFQNDPAKRVMILSIPVAVGLTLTAASHVIAVELDWVPGVMSQAEDRCHRHGQKDAVNVYHLVLAGSIDAKMAETLIHKQEVIDRALDKQEVEEAASPVVPVAVRGLTVTRSKIDRESQTITQQQIQAIHKAVRIIAGNCDGARELDGTGFSKVDAVIGHSLADQTWMSAKQAVIGRKLAVKYQRQLPEGLLEQCK